MSADLQPFDAAKYLKDPDDQAELLTDAFASGDAGVIAAAIGIVARARGMTQLANETGIKRQALYRAFSDNGNPTLETVLKVLPALGLRMRVEQAA